MRFNGDWPASERPALKMGVFLGWRWCLPQGDWWEGPTMTIGHHTQVDPPMGLVGYETAVRDVTDTPNGSPKRKKKETQKTFLLAGGALRNLNFI